MAETGCTCAQLPYLEAVQVASAQQQYPNVTHYATSAVILPENQKAASDILTAGFAKVTSPLSNIIVDYPSAHDTKSNNDTAYGWRGNAVIYVWVSVHGQLQRLQLKASVPCHQLSEQCLCAGLQEIFIMQSANFCSPRDMLALSLECQVHEHGLAEIHER